MRAVAAVQRRERRCTAGFAHTVAFVRLQILQLTQLCSHLQHTPKSVFAASFRTLLQSTTLPAPTNWETAWECLQQEDTMRSIASYVLPIIVAAGVSGMMFTATLV
ncbi:hypothetical protein [Novosphingobium olei]|uniref:hypothetical protein n=1 Tax=Novosphingobium olei TaxID=2728851 RepID=UPI00308A15B3|nr:hypothetical protein NSDW_03120 [Novosphingobium olei]